MIGIYRRNLHCSGGELLPMRWERITPQARAEKRQLQIKDHLSVFRFVEVDSNGKILRYFS